MCTHMHTLVCMPSYHVDKKNTHMQTCDTHMMSSICCAHGDYPQNDNVFNYVNGTTRRPGTPLAGRDDEYDDVADDVGLRQCGHSEDTGVMKRIMMMRTRLTATVTGGLWFESSESRDVNAGCRWMLQSRDLDFWFTDEAVVNQNIGWTLSLKSLFPKLSKVWSTATKGRAHSSLLLICCLFSDVRLVFFSPSSTFGALIYGRNLLVTCNTVTLLLSLLPHSMTAQLSSPSRVRTSSVGSLHVATLACFFSCGCSSYLVH